MIFFQKQSGMEANMSQPEEKARNLYKKKKYASALNEFLQLDHQYLKNTDILVMIANCYDATGDKKHALKYYKKAWWRQPRSETINANLAITHYELGNILRSYFYARLALLINSENPSAAVVLGNIAYRRKKYMKALCHYKKALKVRPDFYTANFNAAGIYYDMKNYPAAYFYGLRTTTLYPKSEEAQALFADICLEQNKSDEALKILTAIYPKHKKDYWLCDSLSRAYQQQQHYAEALEMGWKAMTVSKGENSQHINFGYMLYEISLEFSQAKVNVYAKKWMNKYPSNPIVSHMANAIINGENISQVNGIFVREIFDTFANDFEEVLHNLNYKVPFLISKSLDSLYANLKLKKMKILDVGCGTGLCGKYLKKYAKMGGLDGVDISPEMLKIAKQKKVYSHLYNQDLKEFLDSHPDSYDLITAADVFTYFGELNQLFILLYNSLRKNGRVLFSVSENNYNENDYFLHQSGRFLHNQKYIENSLKRQGFFVEKLNRACLRNEGEKKVYGWIVMAQKQ